MRGTRVETERRVEQYEEASGEIEPLERIGEERAREIMEQTELDLPSTGPTVARGALELAGLAPQYEMSLDGRGMAFSPTYEIGGGRKAVVGYIENDEGKMVARSYYRSNSQGLWRYLPDYKSENGEITQYGKGVGEESVTLPIELQKVLNEIGESGNQQLSTDRVTVKPEQMFVSLARKQGDREGEYYREVETKIEGAPEFDVFLDVDEEVSPPDGFHVAPEQEPDFSHETDSYQTRNEMYGEMEVNVYESRDGNFRYAFYSDTKGRSWIGQIDTKGKVMATGLRQTHASGGPLTTPAMEYRTQAGEYGDSSISEGPYEDMYKNYNSKMKIIQDYEKSRVDKLGTERKVA
jgi:hypothetical protein